jgi:hypothetical protein
MAIVLRDGHRPPWRSMPMGATAIIDGARALGMPWGGVGRAVGLGDSPGPAMGRQGARPPPEDPDPTPTGVRPPSTDTHPFARVVGPPLRHPTRGGATGWIPTVATPLARSMGVQPHQGNPQGRLQGV